jgi:hypothetical protein
VDPALGRPKTSPIKEKEKKIMFQKLSGGLKDV